MFDQMVGTKSVRTGTDYEVPYLVAGVALNKDRRLKPAPADVRYGRTLLYSRALTEEQVMASLGISSN